MPAITPVRMPKWGLSMQEGTVVHWWKKEGSAITDGDELVDIETPKITNVYEAPFSGTLRRIVAKEGETLPVGALLGVAAEADVSDEQIEAFVAEFQANFVPEEADNETGTGMVLAHVDVGGRLIQVGRAGPESGTPVVLLHGFSGDLNNWLFNVEAVAAVAPVVAVDLPGHGGSTKDVGNASLGALSADVLGVMDALDIGKAHLVGHSLGAAVAARLAADHAAHVASLVLICPACLPGTTISEEFVRGVMDAQRARELRTVLELLFADPSLVTKQMLEDMIRYKRLDGADDALRKTGERLLSAEDARQLAADLGRITHATIIASRTDNIVGVPDVSALPASFSLHFVEGAGHMPHVEKAAEVNAILLEALAL